MPFAETHIVDERTRFIEDVHRSLRSFSAICESYGISRQTGYKWLDRWKEEGPPGLENHSSRPHGCPWATPPEVATKAGPALAPRSTRVRRQLPQRYLVC